MRNIFNWNKIGRHFSSAFAILVIGSLVALFSWRLGEFSLQSYDEAWYGSIAREIIRSGDAFDLSFNFERFNDHPPLGFIFMSASMLIFGDNEFGVRFASALFGVGCVVLMFLIGRVVGNRWVGVAAASMLTSSMWFMLRARSGNLDVPLLFFSLLTVWSLLKASINRRFFFLSSVAFASTILTKTLVGTGLIPVIAYGYYSQRKRLDMQFFIKNVSLVFALIFPWYLYQSVIDATFWSGLFGVAFRPEGNSFQLSNLSNSLMYLQIAMGSKWFKLSILGWVASLVIAWRQKEQRRNIVFLWLYLMGFALPLLPTANVEIWHLLPVLPPLCLIAGLSAYYGWQLISPRFVIAGKLTAVAIVALGAWQFRRLTDLLYVVEANNTQKAIAQAAQEYDFVYLFDTFYPATVYYSDTRVEYSHVIPKSEERLRSLLDGKSATNSAIIVNRQTFEELRTEKVRFSLLHENDQYLLIR